ncbi:hypothetical protein MKX08_000569 [Trichoderma sp. CBMAI-0020]|nr:hypothetical protein MKX08_000569 [Trichoderma sp. CBMAI-0020]
MHRRRTQAQQEQERDLAKHRALPAREMLEILRDSSNAETSFFHNKIQGILWTYPWCKKMWRQFPEVLGINNTYKTNRFNIYLFKVIGITDQKSVANFAFGLINTEKEDGFLWLSQRLEEVRQELHVPTPTIIITDKEMALKNALETVFPGTQQQLCVYHVNANVRGKIQARWKNKDGTSDADEAGDEAEAAEEDLNAARAIEAAADEPSAASKPAVDSDSREGMFKAWQHVVYAEDEAEFEVSWAALKATYSRRQNHILNYISKEYMPFREQWARCFIKRYRNFGQKVNSPVETAHKDVKSFLVSGTSDLLHLHNAIILMLTKKERDYEQNAARMQMRQRQRFIQQQHWLGNIPMTVSYVAVNLLAQQHRLAVAAMPSASIPFPKRLEPCTGCFMQQYALPCAHIILKKLEDGQALCKEDVHPRWWLTKPLDMEEPLLRIRDPDVVQTLRGRPRLPNNKKMTIPSTLRADDGEDDQQQRPRASQQPRALQQPSQRRLNPSIRRVRSQFEVEGEIGSSQAQGRARSQGRARTSSQSTRSSQSQPNSQQNRTTRGRSQGARSRQSTRLAALAAAALDVEEVIPATQPAAATPDEPDELAGP